MASRLGERLGISHWLAKIHDSLRFLEPERSVRCVSLRVLNWRISRKLATAVGRRPALNFINERTRHAFMPGNWRNVQPFQESDR